MRVFLPVSHSFPPSLRVTTPSLLVLNSGQMERGGGDHMQNLPSNWLPAALPDTSAVCFLVFLLTLTCGVACGNEKGAWFRVHTAA